MKTSKSGKKKRPVRKQPLYFVDNPNQQELSWVEELRSEEQDKLGLHSAAAAEAPQAPAAPAAAEVQPAVGKDPGLRLPPPS